MGFGFGLAFLFGILSGAISWAAQAGSASIVSVSTSRGVHQAFILIKPDHPAASVILFAGGDGVLGLTRAPPAKVGPEDFVNGNFLVRSRQKFAAHDLLVAVIDAPSDHQDGMSPHFRVSKDHAIDLGAVADYLKGQAGVPVWLVGTSAGTWSASRGAIGAGRDGIATKSIDGLVLSSTVTHVPPESQLAKAFPAFSKNYPDGVMSMALPQIRIPTLIVSHSEDSCEMTPSTDAPALAMRLTGASKVEIALLTGGYPRKSGACEAYAPHGYFGLEAQAVDRIAQFITANHGRVQ